MPPLMHVPRRLVAADQDQQRLHQQLLVVELLAVDLGVDQDADQVLARAAPRRSARTRRW